MNRRANLCCIMAALFAAYPVHGQVSPTSALPAGTDTGRTAAVGGGEVGQRQSRVEAAPNIAPLGRVNNRISSRVQNRIRSRIDRNYDPLANTASPFEEAGAKARKTVRGDR